MQKYTNAYGIPLSLAVWLANDDYDYTENAISVTGLIKPIRQLILSRRVPQDQAIVDIESRIASRKGTAIHDAIEYAWKNKYKESLASLGQPEQVINNILINPRPEDIKEDSIPVYLELRKFKEFRGHKISGKFDFVAEGIVEDFKTTSVYKWMNDDVRDYQLQGSMYRWLNPDIITEDFMKIQFIFTDWSAHQATTNNNYPSKRTEEKKIPLLSIRETEHFIENKLAELEMYKNADEADIPRCTDEELWRKAPVWKYYKNPNKLTRSTKNFDNEAEAYNRRVDDGNVGTVIKVEGEVSACKYCPAFLACTQKDDLIANGSLKV